MKVKVKVQAVILSIVFLFNLTGQAIAAGFESQEQRAYEFISNNMLNDFGDGNYGVFSTYFDHSGDGSLTTGHETATESVSLLADYAAKIGDKTIFDYMFNLYSSTDYLFCAPFKTAHWIINEAGEPILDGLGNHISATGEEIRMIGAIKKAYDNDLITGGDPAYKDTLKDFAVDLAYGLKGDSTFQGAFEEGKFYEIQNADGGWDIIPNDSARYLRKFRVNCTRKKNFGTPESPAFYGYSIHEIFLEDAFGNDLIDEAVATVAFSTENGSNTADKIIDGDLGSRWESVHSSNEFDEQYIEIDLKEYKEVSKIRILWEGAHAVDFDIEIRPDDEYVISKEKNSTGSDTIILPTALPVEEIRIDCLNRRSFGGNYYGYSIWEIKVYDNNNDLVDLAGVTMNSSEIESVGYEAAEAIDTYEYETDLSPGNERWASVHGAWAGPSEHDAFISLTFPSAQQVSKVEVVWQDAYAAKYNFAVVVEGDLSAYTEYLVRPGFAWLEYGDETLDFAGDDIYLAEDGYGGTEEINLDTPVLVQHIDIHCTDRLDPLHGYSLWEVEIFGDDEPDTNLALDCGVESTSIQDGNEAEFDDSYAVDGDMNTRWSSEWTNDETLKIHLSQAAEISRIVLHWEWAAAKDYEIRISPFFPPTQVELRDAQQIYTGDSANVVSKSFVPKSNRFNPDRSPLNYNIYSNYYDIAKTEWLNDSYFTNVLNYSVQAAVSGQNQEPASPGYGLFKLQYDLLAHGHVFEYNIRSCSIIGGCDVATRLKKYADMDGVDAPEAEAAGLKFLDFVMGKYNSEGVVYGSYDYYHGVPIADWSGLSVYCFIAKLAIAYEEWDFAEKVIREKILPYQEVSNESIFAGAFKIFSTDEQAENHDWADVSGFSNLEILQTLNAWNSVDDADRTGWTDSFSDDWDTVCVINRDDLDPDSYTFTAPKSISHVRIKCRTKQDGKESYTVKELRVLDESQANLALGGDVSVLSTESSGFSSANLVDGLDGTSWFSPEHTDDQFIEVEIAGGGQSAIELSQAQIVWGDNYPAEFGVLYWRIDHWATAYYTDSCDGTPVTFDLFNDDEDGGIPVVAKVVKVVCKKLPDTASGISIKEIKLFDTYSVNVAQGRNTSSGTLRTTPNIAPNVNDDNTDTCWSSKRNSVIEDPQWVYVDLGEEKDVKKIEVIWGDDNAAVEYEIQVYPPRERARIAGTGTLYNTIEEAIAASSDGDTIEVRAGEYVLDEALIINDQNDTHIRNITGGFDYEWGGIQADEHTVLNGENSGQCLKMWGSGVISNITFKNGYADKGGLECMYYRNISIQNCIFENNNGAVYISDYPFGLDATVNINGCTFENNYTLCLGAGVAARLGSVSNSTFIGNRGPIADMRFNDVPYTGCKFIDQTETCFNITSGDGLELRNCEFENNSYDNALINASLAEEITIRNCLFINNEASAADGSAVLNVSNAYTTIMDIDLCTFAGNKGAGANSSAVNVDVFYQGDNGTYTIDNSIFYNETANEIITGGASDFTITNCLIGENPFFADAENGDYRLQYCSPAIDASTDPVGTYGYASGYGTHPDGIHGDIGNLDLGYHFSGYSLPFVYWSLSVSSTDGSNVALNAMDNDTGTYWKSNPGNEEWLSMDFGMDETFNTVLVDWNDYSKKHYQIEVSQNGTDWDRVYQKANSQMENERLYFDEQTAKYLRIKGILGGSAGGYSIDEIKVLRMPVYPEVTASSVENDSADYLAKYAVDGDRSTRWASNPNDNESIILDYGEPKLFDYVVLYWENAYGEDYDIYVSFDGSSWGEPVAEVRGGDGKRDDVYVGPQYVQFVKMQGIKRANVNWPYSIYEISIDENVGEPHMGTSSDVSLDRIPEFADDAVIGGSNTRWESEHSDPQFIFKDLKTETYIDNVVISWEGAYATSFTIDISNDGVHWVTVHEEVGTGSGSSAPISVGRTARYVRMNGTERRWFGPYQYGYSIFEFAVNTGAFPAADHSYSTFFGGTQNTVINKVKVDASGNIYVVGQTNSSETDGFPVTAGAYQSTYGGGTQDGFYAKFSPAGQLLYCTYVGGSNEDSIADIEVDASGDIYLAGKTYTSDFVKATDTTFDDVLDGGRDAFIAKYSADGTTRMYCSYLGGSGWDYGLAITVDSAGCAYASGFTHSSNYPVVIADGASKVAQNSFGGATDTFVTKVSAAGDQIEYSTYIGGSSYDGVGDLVVDDQGFVYVAGHTHSTNFFTTPGAYSEPSPNNSSNLSVDGYLVKLKQDGSDFVYSTCVGGDDPDASEGFNDLAVDVYGNVYAVGSTQADDFPATSGALHEEYLGGNDDATAVKLSADGSTLLYATYIGGMDKDYSLGVTIDDLNNVYVSGFSNSTDWVFNGNAIQSSISGQTDTFILKFNVNSGLAYGTFLGGTEWENYTGDSADGQHYMGVSGIYIDDNGTIYVAGPTSSGNFPMEGTPYQDTIGGGNDGYLSIITNLQNAITE